MTNLAEKYWVTVFLTFLRYVSILMICSGVGFILAGYFANAWFYLGTISWPLFIMLGIVNLRFISFWTKANRFEMKDFVKS